MHPQGPRAAIAVLGISLAWVLLPACSSAPSASGGGSEHRIQKVFVDKMRIRRPLGPGADPHAGPGGIDYRSDPLPNERLDCETLASLLAELDLRQVQSCLSGLGEGTAPATYELRRGARPHLELVSGEETHDCLRLVLPRIPVPREIVFQSLEEGRYLCYAARLDVEANQTWGALRLPTRRFAVELKFPLERNPSNADETIRLLGAWALTPIWSDGSGAKKNQLSARIMPDRLCRQCLGDKDFLKEGDPDRLLWP